MRILLSALLVCSFASASAAQTNRDDLTPLEIAYTTIMSDDLKTFEIEIDILKVNRPTLHLAMPYWSPGSYGIRKFGESVRDLKVTAEGGAELEVTRMASGSWSVATEGHSTLIVTYNLVASSGSRFRRRGNSDEQITGRRINGPATYLYVRGAKDRPVTSSYVIPEDWRIANGLLLTDDPMTRRARDYDTFIDAPTTLGIYEERTFDVNGTPFSCVFFKNNQEYDFDIDAFVDIVERIVINIGQLYGSFPFPNYVFLFKLPGGGGLEHLNSTAIGLMTRSQKSNPEAGASVTSHEFFHTWNVKRIRPETLGPFDYDQENYTGNLWVSEGWTSYFGTLTLKRIDVLDADEYLNHLKRIIQRELNKERREDHSVFWASRNAWHRFRDEEGSRVDYYAKGEILGAMIDLRMRHLTDNRKSLNDVMRFLNRWFAESDVGFKESDIERACTAVSNHDFSEFFARHVYGTLDPPIAEILAYAGIHYTEDVITAAFPFSLIGTRIPGRASDDEEPDMSKPIAGERIESIDGEDFSSAIKSDFLRSHKPGDVVELTLSRSGDERQLEVTLSAKRSMIPHLNFMEKPTDLQLRIRESWLNSVE